MLVEIQLYLVIFVNRFFIGSGYLIPTRQKHGNKTGMAHSNNKYQNRYLVKDLLIPALAFAMQSRAKEERKRYFSSFTGSTAGITQPFSCSGLPEELRKEKPLKDKCCSKIAEEIG